MVMPVYNGQKYLTDTLDSVLSQAFQDWELICVDDSSTDDSLRILEEYARKDPRIRIFTKPGEGSSAKTTKVGIDHINPLSKWLYYLSQDDLLSPDLLENLYDRAQETQASVVFPDMVWYYADPQQKQEEAERNDFIGYNGDRNIILTGREAFVASNIVQVHGFMLASMDIVRKVGYHDFSFNSGDASGKFWLLESEKVAFSEGTFYYRQDNSGAITKKISPLRFEIFHTNEWMVEYIRENHPEDRSLHDSVKSLQLLDLFLHTILFYRCADTFTSDDKYRVKQMIKSAWSNYKRTGVYWMPSTRGLLISLVVNIDYRIFNSCIRFVCALRR